MKSKIYFNSLKLKEKILLYIIPILIIVVYILNMPSSSNEIINHSKISNKRLTQIEHIKYFESIIKKYKLTMINIKFNNTMNIKLEGNINNIIKFVNTTYLKYEIISYSIRVENKNIQLAINYNLNTNINILKNLKKEVKLKNPFIKSKIRKERLAKAIIGEYVLINKKWYTNGDKYKGKIIYKIHKNYVELIKDDILTIVKVFDEK